jgi:hypothetical protein
MNMLTIKPIALFLLFLFVDKISYGQSLESDSTKSIRITLDCTNSQRLSWRNSPLYIITVDNKRLQIPEDGNFMDSIAIGNSINFVNPNWIKSIDILKGKDATDKYGALAQNGVVLIELKKGSLTNFPPKIRKKFKKN